jgi:hypothetical protein
MRTFLPYRLHKRRHCETPMHFRRRTTLWHFGNPYFEGKVTITRDCFGARFARPRNDICMAENLSFLLED